MARLFVQSTFKKPKAKLSVTLGRDLKEEREILDYLAEMNPSRVPQLLTDMLITGYYHLVKRPQGSGKEPNTRARAMKVIEKMREDNQEEDLLMLFSHLLSRVSIDAEEDIWGKRAKSFIQPQNETLQSEVESEEIDVKEEVTNQPSFMNKGMPSYLSGDDSENDARPKRKTRSAAGMFG